VSTIQSDKHADTETDGQKDHWSIMVENVENVNLAAAAAAAAVHVRLSVVVVSSSVDCRHCATPAALVPHRRIDDDDPSSWEAAQQLYWACS